MRRERLAEQRKSFAVGLRDFGVRMTFRATRTITPSGPLPSAYS
jgi:hypothetical protein